MSEPQFTEGPWHAAPLRLTGPAPGCDIGAENGANIALVHHDPLDREPRETVANARLIAASRELYAALRNLVAEFNNRATVFPASTEDAIEVANAALAAAEGRS